MHGCTFRVLQGLRGYLAQLDHLVTQVKWGTQVLLDDQENLVVVENQDHKDQEEIRDPQLVKLCYCASRV